MLGQVSMENSYLLKYNTNDKALDFCYFGYLFIWEEVMTYADFKSSSNLWVRMSYSAKNGKKHLVKIIWKIPMAN